MSAWCYIAAAVSGFLYGVLELTMAHRRMKRDALRNPWGIAYLLANATVACGLFVLLSSRNPSFFNVSSNPVANTWFLAICAGPLIGLGLRHIGAKVKGGKDLVSFHDRVFDFLRQEVQHSVDVARVQLSRQLADMWAEKIDELAKVAVDYVESVMSQPKAADKEKRYISALVEERAAVALARYVIENYGDAWVKRNLLQVSKEGNRIALPGALQNLTDPGVVRQTSEL